MDDMPRRQPIGFGDLGVAGGAAAQRAALGEQFRPGGAMDRAVYAAAAEQRGICRVDDGVNAQGGDIGGHDVDQRGADLPRRCQAEAGAAVATPFSASSCCNSPAWNISRMMSQPPTNSPLT